MSDSSAILGARTYVPGVVADFRSVAMAADFGAPAPEYAAARDGAALLDLSDRGRIVVTGRDRRAWLDNLVTTAVTTLAEGHGAYAFAVNVKGRILFDLNILALRDALWLDVDAPTVPAALAHFERFLFTEDVRLEAVTSASAGGGDARLACCGPQAAEVARPIGVPDLAALPEPAVVELTETGGWLIRHDFWGLPGFELLVPRADGPLWWDRLVTCGARPAGWRVREALRIEAGRPPMGGDLDAVSDAKGCYLGHEIIERMRSRGVVAKRLVRLQLADGAGLTLPATISEHGAELGKLTSLVAHPARPGWIGLGYLRTPIPESAALGVGEPPRAVTMTAIADAS